MESKELNPLKPYTLFYGDWSIEKHSIIHDSTRILKNEIPVAFIEMEEFQKEYIINYTDPDYSLDSLMIFTGIYYSEFFYKP